jgi:hypothetical protein
MDHLDVWPGLDACSALKVSDAYIFLKKSDAYRIKFFHIFIFKVNFKTVYELYQI